MDKFLFLYIKDLRIFYHLTKKLKSRGMNYSIFEGEYFPYRDTLIVSDSEGIEEIKKNPKYKSIANLYEFLDYDKYPNFNTLYVNILREIRHIKEFSNMICAIDPGEENIGLAYFLDNKLLTTELVHNPLDVIDNLNLYIYSLNPVQVLIKIGKGNLKSMRDVLLMILGNSGEGDHNELPECNNLTIQLVDEEGSSQKKIIKKNLDDQELSYNERSLSKDEKAAIWIGIREGAPISYDQLVKIMNKEVPLHELKNIQRISRKISGGQYSLSLNQARKVYLGQISMESALHQQKDKSKKRKNSC